MKSYDGSSTYNFAAALEDSLARADRPKAQRLELDGEPAERKPTAYERRLGEAHRLHQAHVPEREIASRMGVSLPTVRKYLAAPSGTRVTKPSEMHSTAFSGSGAAATLSPRQEALRERIRALRDEGLVRSAIADRLGKTDRTVGRYLQLLEQEAAA